MKKIKNNDLALHKSLKSAHDPQEADRLMREVESTDKAIDGLVYELYGLTEEEIKIVEGRRGFFVFGIKVPAARMRGAS
jgi:hypothetical protein